MNDRRRFLVAFGAVTLGKPLASLSQQKGRVWRIGFLFFGSRQSAAETGRTDVFLQSMRELGYAAGRDFTIEERYSDGKNELVRTQAAELAHLKVDVIVATGNPAIHAARRVTTTIPIIATTSFDPVAEGLAASLARPGGNITGFLSSLDLTPKNLELLMTAVPGLSRVAVLMNPGNTGHSPQLKAVQAAAQKAGMQVLAVKASTPDDIDRGIAAMARDRYQALLVMGDNFFSQQARQIAELALKYRLPSISAQPVYAKAGGLMSHGQDNNENIRRAAGYVDKIFRGAKAGELPFERFSRTHMVINRKTAKALGLTITRELLVRADEVIE